MDPLQAAREQLLYWQEAGPAVFAADVFGITPDPWHYQAGELLVKRKKLSIRSGHGVGKTALLAWTIIWFITTREEVRIPCTAPSSAQLESVLWPEVAKWHRRNRFRALADCFTWTTERFYLTGAPQASFAVARTARKETPEALQGFHADNLLYVVDEASGVDDAVFETSRGSLSAEGAYCILAGNPTRTSGYFYDTHHRLKPHWATLRVSSEESPRVSKEYVEGEAAYGTDSNVYRVRVLGEFPRGDFDTLIPMELLEAALDRQVESYGKEIWGLDVARHGDDRTVLTKRSANTVKAILPWKGLDTMQVCGRVCQEYDDSDPKPESIYIDVIGLGAGVVDRLTELGLPVVGVNVAESASSSDQYHRLRDELWYKGLEWFQKRDCKIERVPHAEALIAELAVVKSLPPTSSGKSLVESKSETKRRLRFSPDLADSLLLTFAHYWGKIDKPIRYPKLRIV